MQEKLERIFGKELFKQVFTEFDQYQKAFLVVNHLFKDKVDKGGKPYLEHLYYVSSKTSTLKGKITGLLHDVIEGTELVARDLSFLGFSKDIVASIEILSRSDNMEYMEYINNLINSNDEAALEVKKIDMEHNMDPERLSFLKPDERTMLEIKYNEAYPLIERKNIK